MERTIRELLDKTVVIIRKMSGEILYWTQGCHDLFGFSQDESLGLVSHELLKTIFTVDHAAIIAQVHAEGEWTGRLQQTAKGGNVVWTLAAWSLREASISPEPVVAEQYIDITDLVELEEQRNLLSQELEHRLKNLLAIVQGLARNSFPDADKEAQDKFHERLSALAEANRVLWEGAWHEADLRQLVAQIALALGVDQRIVMMGPKITIGSVDAVGFALAVHELCTNALKHGALSVPGGRVELTWSIDQDGRDVLVRWEENGGPSPAEIVRDGFGLGLIKNAIPGRQSAIDIHFLPSGAVCEIQLSLAC